jgi:hypothetical protein
MCRVSSSLRRSDGPLPSLRLPVDRLRFSCLAQALLSVVVVLILVLYVAIDFRRPLPPLPDYLGPDNYNGLSAIAVMPISLISATIFSEAMWQRCAPTTHHRLRAPCPLAKRGLMLCFDTPCFGSDKVISCGETAVRWL